MLSQTCHVDVPSTSRALDRRVRALTHGRVHRACPRRTALSPGQLRTHVEINLIQALRTMVKLDLDQV
jgi:hypothetical protein